MSLNWPSGTPGSYADFFLKVFLSRVWTTSLPVLEICFFWPVSTVSRLEDEYTFRPGYCKPFVAAKVIILHHRFECYRCLDITYKIYIDIIILYMYYIIIVLFNFFTSWKCSLKNSIAIHDGSIAVFVV